MNETYFAVGSLPAHPAFAGRVAEMTDRVATMGLPGKMTSEVVGGRILVTLTSYSLGANVPPAVSDAMHFLNTYGAVSGLTAV